MRTRKLKLIIIDLGLKLLTVSINRFWSNFSSIIFNIRCSIIDFHFCPDISHERNTSYSIGLKPRYDRRVVRSFNFEFSFGSGASISGSVLVFFFYTFVFTDFRKINARNSQAQISYASLK